MNIVPIRCDSGEESISIKLEQDYSGTISIEAHNGEFILEIEYEWDWVNKFNLFTVKDLRTKTSNHDLVLPGCSM